MILNYFSFSEVETKKYNLIKFHYQIYPKNLTKS